MVMVRKKAFVPRHYQVVVNRSRPTSIQRVVFRPSPKSEEAQDDAGTSKERSAGYVCGPRRFLSPVFWIAKVAKIAFAVFRVLMGRVIYPWLFSPRELLQSAPERLRKKVEGFGFAFEEHEVKLVDGDGQEDGRLVQDRLMLHRVRGPNMDPCKPPVLLQHGMLCCSADFLHNSNSLGFHLAGRGYDVWLGNFRGNTFSGRPHPGEAIFSRDLWEHTFHEHGRIDLPAMIDRVLKETGHHLLDFVGHSMGSTAFFVMAASFPEMQSKVKSACLLSPVADGCPNWKLLVHISDAAAWLSKHLGIFVIIFPHRSFIGPWLASTCFFMLGFFHLRIDVMREIVAFTPSECSINTFRHYAQNIRAATFGPYDDEKHRERCSYEDIDMEDYEHDSLPMARIRTPVRIWYSRSDCFTPKRNLLDLAQRLPNLVGCYEATSSNYPYFGHLDYVWGEVDRLNRDIEKALESSADDGSSQANIIEELNDVDFFSPATYTVFAFVQCAAVNVSYCLKTSLGCLVKIACGPCRRLLPYLLP